MTDARQLDRLAFLVRVTGRELEHLLATDARLFINPFNRELAAGLSEDIDLAERVDAFVGRFARLQDTVGDKLIPALLAISGEHVSTFIDNFDRAEKFGWVSSASNWLVMRKLRNQMIHEYVEDPVILADALNRGHEFVGVLVEVARRCIEEAERQLAKADR